MQPCHRHVLPPVHAAQPCHRQLRAQHGVPASQHSTTNTKPAGCSVSGIAAGATGTGPAGGYSPCPARVMHRCGQAAVQCSHNGWETLIPPAWLCHRCHPTGRARTGVQPHAGGARRSPIDRDSARLCCGRAAVAAAAAQAAVSVAQQQQPADDCAAGLDRLGACALCRLL